MNIESAEVCIGILVAREDKRREQNGKKTNVVPCSVCITPMLIERDVYKEIKLIM